jgi:predicted TIM-barrel fold metal-dependent hydrolase
MSAQLVVSADSHVAETEDVYKSIDPAFEAERPRAISSEAHGGAILKIPRMDINVPMGLVCTAGRAPEDFGKPVTWDELHPAGNDSKARLAVQDEEGISAEVIFPSLGMVLCNHPDIDYKKACFDAYNRWLGEFCSRDPERLLGMPLLGLRTIDEGVEELEQMKAMGFKGVMLSGNPAVEDYDHPCYDPFWEKCVELNLPVNFHILATKGDMNYDVRGSKLITQIVTIRGVQNIIMMMVFGSVFERHPGLRVVCVESDAGWVPHLSFRMDHAWERHSHWMNTGKVPRPPSEYVRENIYMTFQDDYSVKHVTSALNMNNVMWASDFPHSDGTYPHSREVMASVTEGMSDEHRDAILYKNVSRLYGLSL